MGGGTLSCPAQIVLCPRIDNPRCLPHDLSGGEQPIGRQLSVFAELKRRNVFRVGAAYVAVSWLIIQVVETLFPVFELSDAAIRVVVIVLAIGFFPALISAWVFELTPEGFRREAEVDHDSAVSRRMTRRLDRLFIVALALALGFFAVDKFVLDPARDAEELASATEQAREEGRTEAREKVRDSSVAVLPFQDLSPEGGQQYFGDGLSVDLINQLGKTPDLRVTGRTSAFAFKGKGVTIPDIGETLNVAHVLDGTITKAGNRVRISVQLVDTRQDTQLWSETYDQTLGDIFDIRDEITLAIYDRLTIEFDRLRRQSLRTEPEVYDLTLRARAAFERSISPDDNREAADLLARALAIDPDYVPALLFRVYATNGLNRDGLISDEETSRLYDDSVNRVLAIDPDNGTALGMLAWDDWEARLDLESAGRRFSDALRTAPGDLELTRFAGTYARSIGRHAESIALLERCVAADPQKNNYLFQLAQSYLWAGRFDDALRMHHRRHLQTGRKDAAYYVMLALLMQGEPAPALSRLQSLTDESQDHPQMLAARAMIMHDLGRREESEAALAKIVGQMQGDYRDHAYLVAEAYAWIGDRESAFEWLERAYAWDERFGIHGFWFHRIMFLPIWQKLHDDPRWDEFLERMNMSPARLDAIEFSTPPWIKGTAAT
jgi:TolB-like protein/thioredoxin-like negative regulator of GroEL